MTKNIVLCSDGTGNSGGKGKGSNVWQIYQAIDRHSGVHDQIAFYDDGVGTEENKYIKLLGGTVGWGFTRNVKDLYKALVKNYVEDADIYMFGFSRGAYTVRALAAFVANCGVIANGRNMPEKALDNNIERLLDTYSARAPGVQIVNIDSVECTHPRIKCVGVWDTVSAIGVPFDILLEKIILGCFKLRFRDQDLSPKVDHGFHALAIDDERLTFHPVTWNARDDVEQVWFAGMHSNVGGGYPKQGMAYVALDWMMEKIEYTKSKGWGLHFDPGLRNAARHHANVHDKLYNSRAGVAAYYRLRPRDLEELTPGDDAVMIHDSVFDRIEAKTLAYNPGNVPRSHDIDIVTTRGSPSQSARQSRVNSGKDRRNEILSGAPKIINARKSLHLAFVLVSILVAAAALHFGIQQLFSKTAADYTVPLLFGTIILVIIVNMHRLSYIVLCLAAVVAFALFAWAPKSWFGGPMPLPDWIEAVLAFALPDLLTELIAIFVAEYPYGAAAIIVVAFAMSVLKGRFRTAAARIFERACDTLRP